MKLRSVSLCAAALALLPVHATAQHLATVYSGATDLTLSSNLTGSLSAFGVQIEYDNPAMVSGTTATFPLVT